MSGAQAAMLKKFMERGGNVLNARVTFVHGVLLVRDTHLATLIGEDLTSLTQCRKCNNLFLMFSF